MLSYNLQLKKERTKWLIDFKENRLAKAHYVQDGENRALCGYRFRNSMLTIIDNLFPEKKKCQECQKGLALIEKIKEIASKN